MKGGEHLKKNEKTFLTGVIILTAANLITKVIGLVFKIPLTNMLGDEGMGYFNTAYQIYTWLYMLSTAGVPVALSMMVSDFDARGRHADTKRLFKLTLLFFSVTGAVGSIAMLVFSKGLASFISADKAYLCILAIAPALFFVCVSSTVRGFFQGKRNMLPTAVSEITESSLKLVIGIALGYYALSKGYEPYRVASYAILGVTVGVAAGAVFLGISAFFSRLIDRADAPELTIAPLTKRELLGSFFKIAIPVMLSSSLLSMSSMFDTLIVIGRLQDIGIAEEAAVALYGNYTAYCVTLFNLPPVLIYPIVSTLLPTLSAANASGDKAKAALLTEKSLKLAALIALPCAVGLGVMSLPILKLIFANGASAEMAAPLLTALSPSVFLIGIMAVTNGLLQAHRLQRYSVISMICGAVVKGALAYILPAVSIGGKPLGIYASPLSTFLFYFTITAMNFYFLARHTDTRLSSLSVFIRPLFASLLCGAAAVCSYIGLTALLGEVNLITLVSIGIAAVIYAVSALLFGAVRRSDIALIPKLDKLLKRIPIVYKLLRP